MQEAFPGEADQITDIWGLANDLCRFHTLSALNFNRAEFFEGAKQLMDIDPVPWLQCWVCNLLKQRHLVFQLFQNTAELLDDFILLQVA